MDASPATSAEGRVTDVAAVLSPGPAAGWCEGRGLAEPSKVAGLVTQMHGGL